MAVGRSLSFSPFNDFEARGLEPGLFNKVVLNVELCLLFCR